MATITFNVAENWLAEFHARFPPEEREDALTTAFLGLLQDDPYSAKAYAEDERRWQNYEATGEGLSTEQVIERLNDQLRRAGLPCAE